jgi:hypothetical protein
MSYLDDLVDWKIDPVAEMSDLNFDQVVTDLLDLVSHARTAAESDTALRLVITGAMELARRTDAPLSQCLETSIIWYYG